jgi:hypothetical protein
LTGDTGDLAWAAIASVVNENSFPTRPSYFPFTYTAVMRSAATDNIARNANFDRIIFIIAYSPFPLNSNGQHIHCLNNGISKVEISLFNLISMWEKSTCKINIIWKNWGN